ncbi:hypothetical protein ASPCAL15090 [Aspergillus calidoustus]|uniref:Uncharacterized protein n=1 Tax=Aspergillus calidoustus TaxID=454130 RepID=A0A0U5CKR9_ASPCI|nr:hypothetical protein ASPCAL15090 [Aspergillus calidoustus]
MADYGAFAEINLSPATKELLQSLGDWTATAEFKTAKEKSWETCSDKNREIVLEALLEQPEIKDKVADESSRRFIIRISGPIPGYFGSSQGPAYVYPLRIHPNTKPSISGIPLEVGRCIEIKSQVFTVTHGADCLIILTVSAS